MAGVREVELGEAGIEYVRKALGWRAPLTRSLDALDLDAGIATTFLPNEIPEVSGRLRDEPDGLTHDDFQHLRQATKDKIAGHFVASEGRGWAMIQEPLGVGLGVFINSTVDDRETRFKVATVGESDILYFLGSAVDSDIEDFREAAIDHAAVSVLGVGGPLTSLEPDSVDWEREILPHVIEHVRFITTEAFDGQALVFWERSASQSPNY